MKKLACVVGLAILPFLTLAKGSDPQHLKAIWDHIDNRLNSQTDLWFKDGFFPTCISLLRFMNAEDPTDYETATNLGWMLENVHKWDEALATYVRYRKDNPAEPDAPFPEANFYFMQKAYSKVPPLLQASIVKHPHPNSYRLLAHSYEKLGLFPDALKVWQQLVADHPEDDAAKVNMNKVEKKISSKASAG